MRKERIVAQYTVQAHLQRKESQLERDEGESGRKRERETHLLNSQVQKKTVPTIPRNTIPALRSASEGQRASREGGRRARERESKEDAHKHHCPPCRRAIFFILVIVPDKKLPVSPNVSFCVHEPASASERGESGVRGAGGSARLTMPLSILVESRTSLPMPIVICSSGRSAGERQSQRLRRSNESPVE